MLGVDWGGPLRGRLWALVRSWTLGGLGARIGRAGSWPTGGLTWLSRGRAGGGIGDLAPDCWWGHCIDDGDRPGGESLENCVHGRALRVSRDVGGNPVTLTHQSSAEIKNGRVEIQADGTIALAASDQRDTVHATKSMNEEMMIQKETGVEEDM
ncbi:hypothetical protein NDU88_005431 [Pleurodeles waltl]|uniref:Uncharacterized protein n=1 Tax=Pleurodeles waltl TaxID=8319 RepID=A0AAV7TAG8_PLEWA|nr:hypothetical protein NDU88_005431 [Pleurodeles waltl]